MNEPEDRESEEWKRWAATARRPERWTRVYLVVLTISVATVLLLALFSERYA